MASEKAELLTEALAAIIDLVPELDRNDYAYIAKSEAPRKPGPADRPPKADPKVRPASPRADDRPPGKHPQPKQKQQQQAPSYDEYPEENISTQVSPVPKRPVPKTKPKPKSKARDPEDDGDGTIPWSEFAEDGEGGTVQPADAAEEEEMARRRNAREEIRFNSISEELKAINAGLIDPSEISTVSAVDTRQACQHCGRKFLPDRLGRHIKVCEDLKRGKEWRGTWKSPHKSDLDSQKSLLTSSFKV